MEKKTINLVNSDAIEDYLKKFCNGNERLEFLLITALAKIIKKDPECMETLQALPENSPSWLKEKWDGKREWHQFSPKKNIRLVGWIQTTLAWIQLAIENDLEWLKNTDDKGRPYKLLKISQMQDIWNLHEEDGKWVAARNRENGRKNLKQEQEDIDFITVLEFVDGHRFVRLLTERALDRESAFMEHCIGDGAYDESIASGRLFTYSLRTNDNIPVATIAIDIYDWCIHTIASQRNNMPASKYIPYIAVLSQELKIDMTSYFVNLAGGHGDFPYSENLAIVSANDVLKKRYNSETYFEYKEEGPILLGNNISMKGLHIANMENLQKFPRNLSVEGDVFLYGDKFPQDAPVNLKVGGTIYTKRGDFKTVEDFLTAHYPFGKI